jgi:ABC-type xylose transport system permease subunit
MQSINIIIIIAGILLLIMGRKLYWLSVGAIGFLLGYYIATRFFSIGESWINLLIAIISGFTLAFIIYFFNDGYSIGRSNWHIYCYLTSGLFKDPT